MSKFGAKLQRGLGKTEFLLKKRSPEILIGMGIAGFISTVVVACKRTSRMDEVIERHRERMAKIDEAVGIYQKDPENELKFDEKDAGREKVKTYALTTARTVRVYAPAVGLGTLSIGCFLASYKIMRMRYLGMVALAQSIQATFDAYRKRVRDEYGDQLDRHFRYGTTYDTVKVIDCDDDGNITESEVPVETTEVETTGHGIIPMDDACRLFDSSNQNWDPNHHFSMRWLRGRQMMLNDMLHARGHVFLNEVYDALGYEHTPVGAVVGWISGEGDDMIDFFGDMNDEQTRRFVNGQDNVVILTFNHQGPIYDRI